MGILVAMSAPSELLSHYAPPGLPDSAWLDKIRPNLGEVMIARDGQVFALMM